MKTPLPRDSQAPGAAAAAARNAPLRTVWLFALGLLPVLVVLLANFGFWQWVMGGNRTLRVMAMTTFVSGFLGCLGGFVAGRRSMLEDLVRRLGVENDDGQRRDDSRIMRIILWKRIALGCLLQHLPVRIWWWTADMEGWSYLNLLASQRAVEASAWLALLGALLVIWIAGARCPTCTGRFHSGHGLRSLSYDECGCCGAAPVESRIEVRLGGGNK